MRYNLGCGARPITGYVNVDRCEFATVDIVADLNRTWEFALDDSAEEIVAHHVLEHLDSVDHFLREAHRVLKVGGELTLSFPYGASIASMADPTHKHQLYLETFNCYTSRDAIYGTFSLQHIDKDVKKNIQMFDIIKAEAYVNVAFKKIPFWRLLYPFCSKFMFNVIVGMGITLKKV